MMIVAGWVLHMASLLLNFVYYKIHPSATDVGCGALKKRMVCQSFESDSDDHTNHLDWEYDPYQGYRAESDAYDPYRGYRVELDAHDPEDPYRGYRAELDAHKKILIKINPHAERESIDCYADDLNCQATGTGIGDWDGKWEMEIESTPSPRR